MLWMVEHCVFLLKNVITRVCNCNYFSQFFREESGILESQISNPRSGPVPWLGCLKGNLWYKYRVTFEVGLKGGLISNVLVTHFLSARPTVDWAFFSYA